MGQLEIERRSSPRKRVLKAAKIVFPNGGSVMDCAVRNISDTGAKITLPSAVGVPETFMLLIEADGTRYACAIVRRETEAVGVRFVTGAT